MDVVSEQPTQELITDDSVTQTLENTVDFISALSEQPTQDVALTDDSVIQTLTNVQEFMDVVSEPSIEQPVTELTDDSVIQTLTNVQDFIGELSEPPLEQPVTELTDDSVIQTLENVSDFIGELSEQPIEQLDMALTNDAITETLENVAKFLNILDNAKPELSNDSRIYIFDKLPSTEKVAGTIGDMASRFGSRLKDTLDSLYTDDDAQRYEVDEYMETINSDDKNQHNYRTIMYDADGSHISRISDDYEHKWNVKGEWNPENNYEAVYSINGLNDKLPPSDRVFIYDKDGSKKPIYTKEYTKHNWYNKPNS
jgi:hypothetical protein